MTLCYNIIIYYNIYAGTAAIDQIPGQITNATPERADGGVGKVGPVSAGNVRRDFGRESAGGGVRTHLRVLGSLLACDTSASHARPERIAIVDATDQELAEHGHAHHGFDDEQLPAVR